LKYSAWSVFARAKSITGTASKSALGAAIMRIVDGVVIQLPLYNCWTNDYLQSINRFAKAYQRKLCSLPPYNLQIYMSSCACAYPSDQLEVIRSLKRGQWLTDEVVNYELVMQCTS
jgi:hypothetical protein